jgi:hypothetical protein
MSRATENLQSARQRAMAGRPKVGGFPYLAETLRRGGGHPQLLVFAFLSEPLFDGGRPGHDPGNPDCEPCSRALTLSHQ